MSKGLGAPVGSLICGSAEAMERAWTVRKQMGGGMRQSGLLAAAALFGLERHLELLAADHANARFLGERLAAISGVDVDLAATQTNIVVFDVAGTGRDPLEVEEVCESRGVRLVPFGGARLRAVTHLDVDRADVEWAAGVIEEVLGAGGGP
jgi:threonine aldolase